MENKKGAQQNTSIYNNESANNDALLKQHTHLHNNNPQQLRFLQYGLKIPHPQLNQPHNHVPLNAYPHIHQHVQQQQQIYIQKYVQPHQHMQLNTQLQNLGNPPDNPLNQNNPQIWVPHQPPPHYHQQQQLKMENQQKQIAQSQYNQKPKSMEKKKATGTNQQLRSPSAKRPPEAPVTMQGWLHKQGSEGLMLWKKRWFVLSEYCLFYYKGPEEEKLLGSILLPSYKVSVCGPEDKANKKFAFKLEHANMRTYILAADSQEVMMHWIKVLNAACLLQNQSESPSVTITTSTQQPASNNPIYQTNQAYNRTTPIHVHSSSNATDLSSPSQQELSQYTQPLYANAPPKPRRLNDGSYSSPSPEVSERYMGDIKYVNAPYPKKSPVMMYGGPQLEYIPVQMNKQDREYQMSPAPNVYNVERRTPDTYGRSKQPQSRCPGDYEDIYADQMMYKRPVSPLAAYNNVKRSTPVVAPMQRTYTPVSMTGPRDAPVHHRKPTASIPRPHSADFLEYEVARHSENNVTARQQPRPKSSLDINRNTLNDNYFYSEECYAQNMRKSAQYLPKMPQYVHDYSTRRRQPENTYPLMRSNTQPMRLENLQISDSVRKEPQPVRSRSVLSEGSLSKELELDVRGSPQNCSARASVSPAAMYCQYNQDLRRREYEQFTRSASARLAHYSPSVLTPDGGKAFGREGEKKREESMKRLLEWKQRMLQSPLNRKVSQQGSTRGRQEYYYRNMDVCQHRMHVDPYADVHKSTNALPQYNSYSSDDEENEGGSKENVQAQAGWTLETIPSVSESRMAKLATPTPLCNPMSTHVDQDREDNTPTVLNQFKETPTTTQLKSSGAYIKSILTECDRTTEEENYVTMTPKKSILAPNFMEQIEQDENPYMEMSQSVDILNEQQPYEVVCFSEGKITEPVYMEVNQNAKNQNHAKTELPDILRSPQDKSSVDNKSDSSDADDEASKDMDSLDTPNNPRFSLSDSFRPASYYLGVSQTAQETQDSSDSELVSPPPIPTSPPPINDLDDSINSNFSSSEQSKKDVPSRKLRISSEDEKAASYHEYENVCVSTSPKHVRDSSGGGASVMSYEDFVTRDRMSSFSNSADVVGLLQSSACSTPTVVQQAHVQDVSLVPLYFQQQKSDGSNLSFGTQPAPYYYSDLSMNSSHTDSNATMLMLNNQREAMHGNKRDITHIVNPLKCNNVADNKFKLAAEARSVSVDFLNLADKSGQIDKKNIYESDTLKRLKAMDSVSSLQSNPETRNLYPFTKNEKFSAAECLFAETKVRRSQSLEGLLENVLSETVETNEAQNADAEVTEGSYLWEEDSVWRERLRTASQRHTKSMDDLDSACELKTLQKKQTRGISRLVTYVNDNLYNMPLTDKKEVEKDTNASNSKTEGKTTKESSFIIDREKLRQWDLLSSAPSDAQLSAQSQSPRVNNVEVEGGDEMHSDQRKPEDQASGSVSINIRDTFPRTAAPKKAAWVPHHGSQTIQHRPASAPKNFESDYSTFRSSRPQNFYGTTPCQHDPDTVRLNNIRKGNWQWSDKVNVSAGELLGRTHEELVLLLIQLRRQSTNTCHAIEACYNEIDSIQAQLHLMDKVKKLESLQKLEQIKQHLIELEKQYEKGKPLVNLVDNMVKLGSLYRSPNERINYMKDRLEFNQQIQERRLLAEEKRDWNRLNLSHTHLQEKVQELYQLDRLIHEESSTLQSLQQDKEDIERALGDLRMKINKGLNDPAEIEQARKQQAMLENELCRVHSMLAENSKKLEETVAGNARLEQKLLVLKQRLQISRQQRSSPQFSNPGDSLPCFVGNSAALESDLQRVQQKVGDLQRQRQELSMQVRQLTDRSNSLQQQIKPASSSSLNNLGNKKKVPSLWRETDLDTMNIIDHGETWENSSTTPLFINTDIKQNSNNTLDSASDDTSQNCSTHQEKPEIKTVRIVKRESERRQRDREKTVTGKWDPLFEEDDSSQSSSSLLFCPTTSLQKTQSTSNLEDAASPESGKNSLSRLTSVSSPSVQQYSEDESLGKFELSPVFKSEAAKQIITEMSGQDGKKQVNRRVVPKEKRRHHTAPHNNLIMKSLNQLPTDDGEFDKALVNTKRARDDLDMERALRQRIDAPDVVRSTLSNKELKYNENTIDNILGTPNKIRIPERYIPEQLPQLSAEEQEHRLRKVESIKKMLSDTIITSNTVNLATDSQNPERTPNSIMSKATSKMIEEKKQREHLLQLNQILAKQVMEMSKIVAGTNNPSEQ